MVLNKWERAVRDAEIVIERGSLHYPKRNIKVEQFDVKSEFLITEDGFIIDYVGIIGLIKWLVQNDPW